MSTPTTAVATLPPYHSHPYHPSRAPYSHQQQTTTATDYSSTTANSLLPPASFSRPTRQTQLNSSSNNTAHSSLDGVVAQSRRHQPTSAPQSSHERYDNHISNPRSSPTRIDPNHDNSSTMACSTTTATVAGTDHTFPPAKKRLRSREPNWDEFYRNGRPKEVIVIEDTPEPVANTSRKLAARQPATGAPAAEEASPWRLLKKTKPLDAQQTLRNNNLASDPRTPQQSANHHPSSPSSSSSSLSPSLRDYTNSTLHTTVPSSLQNSQHEQPPSLKRKRASSNHTSETSKRRDVDGLSAFQSYKPPVLPPKKVPDLNVRVVRDQYHKNVNIDDDDGHYIVVPDTELASKYQIQRLLGQGTFGKVVQAYDRRRKQTVAVKIIRSVQKYRDASRIELRVLATLKANDEENRNRCIHFNDCFDYRGHICIVMDLLGQSVFDFLKGNSFVPFPNSHIQSIARQLFTSVAFLHDLNLIHTDLKPENILLVDDRYQTFTYNRKIPSPSTTINRQATQRRVLLNTEIRLIDFGSATFEDEYHSSVVSTRHYRAPEIILGLGWSYPCDIWSIGCILVEFFTGDALFQTHDNLEHLAMMKPVVGGKDIDRHLVQAVNKMSTRRGGNPASKYFHRLKLKYPTPETTRGSRRFVKAMKQLDQIIPPTTTFFTNFLDLLQRIFIYDPEKRITAKEALDHPFFHELAHPDDGTEAARIGREQMAERETM